MRLFTLAGSEFIGEPIASCLGQSLDPLEERHFDDGEYKIRPLVSVRGKDVYVVHSLYSDEQKSVHDKLCQLLFFIATLKDCGASRVTVIAPYLCYTRKDRRTKARDPVTMRYTASLFEAVGTDSVVTIDAHNLQAYQNAFRCRTEHLNAQQLYLDFFRKMPRSEADLTVMSPDIGGVKRAEQFRERLSKIINNDIGFAYMEKQRSMGIVTGEAVVGNVSGKSVIILDDLINSGATISRAAEACQRQGANNVYAVATHGVFVEATNATLRKKALTKVIVSNTVMTNRVTDPDVKQKLVVLDAAPLLSETIRRLHSGGSLVSLLQLA